MLRLNSLPEKERNRAQGNLSYLAFIALVKRYWEAGHPDIRLRPTQGPAFIQDSKDNDGFFPVIVYGLDTRRAMTVEPKPRIREEKMDDGDFYIISGQRFENLVSFTVYDTNPIRADEVIEAFEDFMLEYTPAFKMLGASELVYFRRTPDNEGSEAGEDLARRNITYKLTTEKVRVMPVGRMEEIVIDARVFLSTNQTWSLDDDEVATIEANIIDTYSHATPVD